MSLKKIDEILKIIDKAANETIKVLQEIRPDIDTLKYEKGDISWILKDRLTMILGFELLFMGILNDYKDP